MLFPYLQGYYASFHMHNHLACIPPFHMYLLSTYYVLDTELAQGLEMPASQRFLSHQTRQSLPFGGSSQGLQKQE